LANGLLPVSFPADAQGDDRNALPIRALAEVDASAGIHVTQEGDDSMHRRTIVEGVMGGTIGAVAIAVWFLCIDVSMGQPFRTPALLGATLFEGLKDPAALHPTVRVVLEYTLVHWVAFVAFGLVAAGLLAAADRDPRLLFVVFMLFCCFEVFALGLISVLAEWLFGVLAWWTLVLANFLAGLIMLGFFFRRHRRTWHQFLVLSE
jgi:Na+-driven multidrug efflux pump